MGASSNADTTFRYPQREPSFALRCTSCACSASTGGAAVAGGWFNRDAFTEPMQLKRDRVPMIAPTVGALPCREATVIRFRNLRADGLILIDRTAPRFSARLLALAAAALFFSATYAAEPEPTPLVDQQHCMFCHTDNAAFLAPSFQQIAERYRNVPNAAAMLEHNCVWVDPPTGAIWPCRHPANGVAPYPRKTPTRWCSGS